MNDLLGKLKEGDTLYWKGTRLGVRESAIVYGFMPDGVLVRYLTSKITNQWRTIKIPYHRIYWDYIRDGRTATAAPVSTTSGASGFVKEFK